MGNFIHLFLYTSIQQGQLLAHTMSLQKLQKGALLGKGITKQVPLLRAETGLDQDTYSHKLDFSALFLG